MTRYLTTIAALLTTVRVIAIPIEIDVPAPAIKATASSVFGPEQDVTHLIDGSGLDRELHDNEGGARTMWHSGLNPEPTEVACSGVCFGVSPEWR